MPIVQLCLKWQMMHIADGVSWPLLCCPHFNSGLLHITLGIWFLCQRVKCWLILKCWMISDSPISRACIIIHLSQVACFKNWGRLCHFTFRDFNGANTSRVHTCFVLFGNVCQSIMNLQLACCKFIWAIYPSGPLPKICDCFCIRAGYD